MATNIKTYTADWRTFPQSINLNVTSLCSDIRSGNCVQFTIGNKYHVLKEKDVRDLIKILQKVIEK